MALDPNKTLIYVNFGESNARGSDPQTDMSSTGVYAPYRPLTTLGANIYTMNYGIIVPAEMGAARNIGIDFVVNVNYGSMTTGVVNIWTSSASCGVDLKTHLDAVSHTERIYVMEAGIGQTELDESSATIDWGADSQHELLYNLWIRVQEIIRFEQEEGRTCDIAFSCYLGINDGVAGTTQYQEKLQAMYDKLTSWVGFEPLLIMIPAPERAEAIPYNALMEAFVGNNSHVHVCGGGTVSNFFSELESRDTDGNIDATDPSTYCKTASFNHFEANPGCIIGIMTAEDIKNNI